MPDRARFGSETVLSGEDGAGRGDRAGIRDVDPRSVQGPVLYERERASSVSSTYFIFLSFERNINI